MIEVKVRIEHNPHKRAEVVFGKLQKALSFVGLQLERYPDATAFIAQKERENNDG